MKISFKICNRRINHKLEAIQTFAVISKKIDWSTYLRYWTIGNSEKVNIATLFETKIPCTNCNQNRKCNFNKWIKFKNPVLILFHEREIE